MCCRGISFFIGRFLGFYNHRVPWSIVLAGKERENECVRCDAHSTADPWCLWRVCAVVLGNSSLMGGQSVFVILPEKIPGQCRARSAPLPMCACPRLTFTLQLNKPGMFMILPKNTGWGVWTGRHDYLWISPMMHCEAVVKTENSG